MLWEIYQQGRIQAAQSQASRAEQKTYTVSEQVDRLEDKIDSLSLICQAMWELLSEHLTEPMEQLNEKVHEIDLRDGKLDGKMTRIERTCAQCNRNLHVRHRRCMYCGHSMPQETIFQK